MIYILYTPNFNTSNKALKFFKKHNIDIKKINLLTCQISEHMIYDILYLSYNGFDDIVNKSHNFLINNKIDCDKLHTKELVHLIKHEPVILKQPIIIQYKKHHPYRLNIGYNSDEIKIFLRND